MILSGPSSQWIIVDTTQFREYFLLDISVRKKAGGLQPCRIIAGARWQNFAYFAEGLGALALAFYLAHENIAVCKAENQTGLKQSVLPLSC
jgi:hypothetical protein